MTSFLVIDLVLRIFPFFSHIFRMFTMLNVVYDHFLTRKPPFFTLFILSRTSDNTASQNIGGDQCMGRPPTSNFLGDRPPSPLLGLRPCKLLKGNGIEILYSDPLASTLCGRDPSPPLDATPLKVPVQGPG